MIGDHLEPVKVQLEGYFQKWIACLGLAWWDISLIWHDDPATIKRTFWSDRSDSYIKMLISSDWRYAQATISVNLPVFEHETPERMERDVVHELCHVLVNEMRENDLDHEERVVTGLTKAFFWVADAAKPETER